MSDETADRIIGVPRSTLFALGRDITTGDVSQACQAVINILTAAANREEVNAEPEPTAERCPSCVHAMAFHRGDGCWFTVARGRRGRDHVCACDNGPVQAEECPTEGDA